VRSRSDLGTSSKTLRRHSPVDQRELNRQISAADP